MKNPILEELWKAKDEIARQCDYDLNKLCDRLRRMQQQGGNRVVDLSADETAGFASQS